MLKKFISILSVSILMMIFTVSILSQVTGGRVSGTITDSTGAVIPGAAVTLRSSTTGQVLTTQTTGAGAYEFPNVPVGQYSITVEKSGFATATQEIRVALNQQTGFSATLQAGGVTGEVTITAAGEALVQTESSQLGKSFEEQLVKNLPIFGNQNALALLSPNVVERSSGVLGSGGSVGGTRARSNVFTIDGVDNNDPSVTGPAIPIIQDAVQEFTLLTNNFNAEFGGGGGGQFVTITKSGTNEFHGSGFVYLQNQHLNAASSSEEAQLQSGQILELPRYRNTRYGFTIGGPILKNKLFFFGAFERVQNSSEGAGRTFLSPTSQGLALLGSVPGASPFVLNILQQNLELAQTASDTINVLGIPIPIGNVSVNIPAGFIDNSFQINIDHLRGTKDQFRYRFNYYDDAGEQAGLGSQNFNNLQVYETRFFSGTWVRTLSSSLVNDLRLSWRRAISDVPLKDPSNLNFPNITVRPLNLELGPGGNLPQSGGDNVYQVFDTVSYIRGQHNFKFGGEFRRILTTSNFLARQRGDYIYNNLEDLIRDITPTGRDGLRGTGNGTFTGNTSRYYFFGQDDWKVTPNLTLNLGLRYEYASIPRATKDFLPFFQGVSVPGLDFENVEPDKNNFAPRIGFAYAPNFKSGILRTFFGERGTSSIRGNFTMSYSDVFQNLIIFSKPPQLEQELDVTQAVAVLGFNTSPGFLQRGGLPSTLLPFTGGVAGVRAAVGGITNSETFIMPETYSFTLSYQRQLTSSMAVEVRYLGTRTRHLPIQLPQNLPSTPQSALFLPTFFSQPTAAQLAGLPTLAQAFTQPGVFVQPFRQFGFFGAITAFPPIGNSQYDSGSISVTRRFSQGLAFTSAYTWSKTIDDSTNELFSSVVNPRRPQNFDNIRDERGLSALDIPHRFVFAANYELPFFKDSDNGFLKGFLGGFVIAPIFQTQSGQPFTPLSGVDSNLNFDSAPDRTIFNPNGVPGTGSRVVPLNAQGQFLRSNGTVTTDITQAAVSTRGPSNAVAYLVVNPNAQYIQTGPGARATAGRNTLRSNGFNRTDVTILKNFRFGGDYNYNLQVGAEIFNLLNQRIREISTVGPRNTGFVNVNSPSFNNYSLGVVPGRTVQLRAKFIF
ncbi:MAG: TonB-dependent receptor [Acidobacteriota bacterium]|jgi:hypothetical protein|nr:TonB-dependent receptor [Acidobacteriota bacterium]